MTDSKFFRQLFGITFLLTVFMISSLDLSAQDDNEMYDDEDDYEMVYEKNVLVGIGHTMTEQGLSLGIGFRYRSIGVNMGFTGFASTIPRYVSDTRGIEKGMLLGEFSYPTIAVSGDLVYYHDFDGNYARWTAFGSVGFYAQNDTVLTEYENVKVRKGFESNNGLTFGFGAQYLYNEQIIFGLGYQTKVGLMATVAIRWE